MAPVLDLIRYRLERDAKEQTDPLLQAAAYEVVELYDLGIVDAQLEKGRVLLSLSKLATEGLPEGGLYELIDRLREEHAAAAGPLNAGPSE